jgi:hypothetical protein
VIGPPINHSLTPMTCWQIKPIKKRKLLISHYGWPRSEFISERNPAFHPDPWLLPIRSDEPDFQSFSQVSKTDSLRQAEFF